MQCKTIKAGVLEIAYLEYGPQEGWPVILNHGFPYDIHAYGEVAPLLADEGARVIVPYLRGYGGTQFLNPETPRSGEQAALGFDLMTGADGPVASSPPSGQSESRPLSAAIPITFRILRAPWSLRPPR